MTDPRFDPAAPRSHDPFDHPGHRAYPQVIPAAGRTAADYPPQSPYLPQHPPAPEPDAHAATPQPQQPPRHGGLFTGSSVFTPDPAPEASTPAPAADTHEETWPDAGTWAPAPAPEPQPGTAGGSGYGYDDSPSPSYPGGYTGPESGAGTWAPAGADAAEQPFIPAPHVPAPEDAIPAPGSTHNRADDSTGAADASTNPDSSAADDAASVDDAAAAMQRIEELLATTVANLQQELSRKDELLARVNDTLHDAQSEQRGALLSPVARALIGLLTQAADAAKKDYSTIDPERATQQLRKELDYFSDRLLNVLELLGYEPVDAEEGDPFDSRFHKAVKRIPTDDPALNTTIHQVLRPGFQFGETATKALFPTHVTVWAYTPPEEAPPAEPSA